MSHLYFDKLCGPQLKRALLTNASNLWRMWFLILVESPCSARKHLTVGRLASILTLYKATFCPDNPHNK